MLPLPSLMAFRFLLFMIQSKRQNRIIRDRERMFYGEKIKDNNGKLPAESQMPGGEGLSGWRVKPERV